MRWDVAEYIGFSGSDGSYTASVFMSPDFGDNRPRERRWVARKHPAIGTSFKVGSGACESMDDGARQCEAAIAAHRIEWAKDERTELIGADVKIHDFHDSARVESTMLAFRTSRKVMAAMLDLIGDQASHIADGRSVSEKGMLKVRADSIDLAAKVYFDILNSAEAANAPKLIIKTPEAK